ncbi:hypothetical protein P152DRAFT_314521 [Eremomyces bilateralis CBS 781.70]|uniref:Urease accessory protein UreF n=1 Tax=Eremomyces bilateralis CBS 781.70 TaxID=1392243 RepID=A0A6G1G5E6_9PEZI|nr:uncharacterized protein P152DRAFT_314521 [Eremomyces bilateralis CBS 781.70]KAF1813315.1 hypothetical protein P152DRAFT_314521 [Eremomyces bilateralis CBS 781.70]
MPELGEEERRSLKEEISSLEIRLKDAKSQLSLRDDRIESTHTFDLGISRAISSLPPDIGFETLHMLLILSDSALPLGSFAFSSGLESYLAHQRLSNRATFASNASNASNSSAFLHFLHLSLGSIASTTLPFVLTGHKHPDQLLCLDNDLDASTPCTVARRASVTQGRALLTLWERSFRRQHVHSSPSKRDAGIDALESFQVSLREAGRTDGRAPQPASASAGPKEPAFVTMGPSAHMAPLFGVLTRVLGLPLRTAAYLYLFSHARTVTSAGVRAGALGPYQAQEILVGGAVSERIGRLIDEGWDRRVEDAGQSVPAVDLWVGRHELLYSRIFNS